MQPVGSPWQHEIFSFSMSSNSKQNRSCIMKIKQTNKKTKHKIERVKSRKDSLEAWETVTKFQETQKKSAEVKRRNNKLADNYSDFFFFFFFWSQKLISTHLLLHESFNFPTSSHNLQRFLGGLTVLKVCWKQAGKANKDVFIQDLNNKTLHSPLLSRDPDTRPMCDTCTLISKVEDSS